MTASKSIISLCSIAAFPQPLQAHVQPLYRLADISSILRILEERGAFHFDVYQTGMFPAVGAGSATENTSGYRAAWVRDNVHVALAHYRCGGRGAAVRCMRAILDVYLKNQRWFTDVIDARKSPKNPMHRPHIRFEGTSGAVLSEKWPHAQNDALGAFLWLLCQMLKDRAIALTADVSQLLVLMIRYFASIAYWQDEDSGHWEEQRKVSASSIGVVNAGIRAYIELKESSVGPSMSFPEQTPALLQNGVDTMARILPAECTQDDPLKNRRYDAALLFLVEPFNIVSDETAAGIVADVTNFLAGEFGVRRYLCDSYWGPDYRTVPPEKRTVDLSDDIIQREAFAVAGQEAQWCIFDSVLSLYWGHRFARSGNRAHLERQTLFLNRALSQLVAMPDGTFQVPEAYFVENGCYVTNDHLPLQWAHANLWRAVAAMHSTCAQSSQ